jgi:hypothetical protein
LATQSTLLIAQQEFKFHEEPLQNPENRFDWDFELIAREAMTQGAQRRFADASFPPELRLQVMKASVSYHAPTFDITPKSTFDDVTKAATSLFDTQHTTDAIDAVLQQTAEQALLETSIFKVERDPKSHVNELNSTRSMAPLLDIIGACIRHLKISMHAIPLSNGFADTGKAQKTLHELKPRLPRLKTCILTVKIPTWSLGNLNSTNNSNGSTLRSGLNFYHVDNDEAIFPVYLLGNEYVENQELKGLLTGLFDTFAEKGPGMRRFVRMMQMHCNQKAPSIVCHYGPLVKVHDAHMDDSPHVISSGADIVTAAFRFARTGHLAGQMKHLWRRS